MFIHIIICANVIKYSYIKEKNKNNLLILHQNIINRAKMKIDPTSNKPLHVQAEEIIRRLIDSDEYKNGKYLPKEVDLSKMLNISRNTLRQAINKLVFEGLLVRKPGVGTKVQQKCIVGGVKNWFSFSQEMKMLGIEIRNFELHVSWKKPSEEICNFFNISPEGFIKCLVLERVRGKKEFPFVYFISYFNPSISLTGEEDYTRPLYEMLEDDYNIIVKTSKEKISASLAGECIAEKLDIKNTDPILIRERFVYDVNQFPVEYNIGYYRADNFTYTIEAQR